MKQLYLSIVFVLLVTLNSVSAQDYSTKFGKPTNYEVKFSAYPQDTTAEAVILCDLCSHTLEYSILDHRFSLNSCAERKIKILKPEGLKYANIVIPYFRQNAVIDEHVNGIEAWVYNLENGKTVKTKLDRKFIFEEESSDGLRLIKFTLTGVKVGSVIEYKYFKKSNRIDLLPDFDIQAEVPLVYGEYHMEIPEYFKYTSEMKGYEKIDCTINEITKQIPGESAEKDFHYRAKELKCVVKDIPALKREAYVWSLENYRAGVNIELVAIDFPGMLKYDLANTWEAVEETLCKKTLFYSNITGSDPYKKEVLTLAAKYDDEKELISAIFSLVKSKIRWNGSYDLLENNPRDAIKNGVGNNVQINSVIYRCLETAGLKPYAVVLRLRENGRIPNIYPTLNLLNSFIVGVDLKNGKSVYMDGSSTYGGLDVLPENLIVDRARKINSTNDKWVNLTQITNNAVVRSQTITFDNAGNINAKLSTYYTDNMAFEYRKKMANHPDSTTLIRHLHERSTIKIDSVIRSGMEPESASISEVIYLTEKVEKKGDYIYINPLYVPHFTKHPFTKSERKLPVEFSYPNMFTIVSNITLPEGYVLADLPKSESKIFEDKSVKVSYIIQQTDQNLIQVKYQFDVKQVLFPNTYYDMIRGMWDFAATKNNDVIVLKKNTL